MRFDPSTGMFRREVANLEQRTPGAITNWLTNWGGDNGELNDIYGLSPWVQRAVRFIAGPISQVEIRFYAERPRGRRKGEVEINDSVLDNFWKRPSQGSGRDAKGMRSRRSRVDTIEATVGWLCMKGEFFWILDDTWLTRGPAKSPILIARPDRMKEVLDDGELIGWQFTDGSGKKHSLITEQVVTSGFWNPDNPHRGAAPARTAEQAAKSDYAAGKFWKSLAESNGDQGMTVIAPSGVSEEQAEQIKVTLRRKREAAKKGQYLPFFVVGDVKTEDPKIQSPDASAVSQRMTNRHEVFAALGVPPSFAEVMASYSVGSASDRYKLIEETCMPIASKIAEAVEDISSRLIGREVSAVFDFDEHSTMQEVRAERMKVGREMHERGVPWTVIDDHLNLGLGDFPGADKAWLPFNLVEVEGKKPQPEPKPTTAASGKVFEELEELLRGCPAHGSQGGCEHTARTQNKSTNAKRWEKIIKGRAPYVKRARGIFDRALFSARAETLANIAEAEKAERSIRSGSFDFVFDITNFLDILIEPFFKVMEGAYAAAGKELMEDEIGDDTTPFIEADPVGLAFLRERRNFIRDMGVDVWNEVRDNLEEGIAAGESYSKLAERVREKFNGISKERSMRIAVTETSVAMESGRHQAMIQAGAEWKQWLTADDERVRLTHRQADGKIVPINEPFDIGGVMLMYPADPNGPAEEIINCRCVHGPSEAPPNPDDIVGNDPSIQIPF